MFKFFLGGTILPYKNIFYHVKLLESKSFCFQDLSQPSIYQKQDKNGLRRHPLIVNCNTKMRLHRPLTASMFVDCELQCLLIEIVSMYQRQSK